MHTRDRSASLSIPMLVLYLLLIACLYIRNCFGIDLEDEPYHVASVFQVLQGGVPLMSIWDGHTGFFILAPFAAIYKALVPSLNGVVLYFRQVGLTIIILNELFIAYLFYKKYDDKRAFLFIIPACFISQSRLINYNSASAMLLVSVWALLFTADDAKAQGPRHLLAGILMGFVCLNYPTDALIAILVGVYLLVSAIRTHNDRHELARLAFYALGVVLVGGAFFAWIFSRGSVGEFQAAVHAVLNAPHTAYRGPISASFIFQTFVVNGGLYFLRGYIGVLFLYAWACVLIRRFAPDSKKTELYVISFLAYCLLSLLPNRTGIGYGIFGLTLGTIVVMFCSDREFIKKNYTLYLIALVFLLIYCLTSDTKRVMVGISASAQLLANAIVITIYLYERSADGAADGRRRHYVNVLLVGLSIVGILSQFGYVYGDGDIYQLRARVAGGVFEGQFTTADKKSYIDDMESFVDGSIQEIPDVTSKKLTVMTLEPMVYLMSDANIYAPQTFDAQYLFKGFFAAGPMTDYFDQYQAKPDIIFATDAHNPDFATNDAYEIKQFIGENYELTSEGKLAGSVDAWVWQLKE